MVVFYLSVVRLTWGVVVVVLWPSVPSDCFSCGFFIWILEIAPVVTLRSLPDPPGTWIVSGRSFPVFLDHRHSDAMHRSEYFEVSADILYPDRRNLLD